MTILAAVDPGTTESAYVVYDTVQDRPLSWATVPNEVLLERLRGDPSFGLCLAESLAMEMIASYGMAVGREVFETCVMIGRFVERWSGPYRMVYRREVKLHLCGSSRAKDPNVRQALLDKFGPGKELAVGKKASPGPLYGLTGDCWAALGVAVTAAETREVVTA